MERGSPVGEGPWRQGGRVSGREGPGGSPGRRVDGAIRGVGGGRLGRGRGGGQGRRGGGGLAGAQAGGVGAALGACAGTRKTGTVGSFALADGVTGAAEGWGAGFGGAPGWQRAREDDGVAKGHFRGWGKVGRRVGETKVGEGGRFGGK